MKQLPLILGVLLLIILSGAGGYYYMNSRSTTTGGDPITGSVRNDEEGTSAFMSLKELMMNGRSQQCTFTHKSPEAGTTSGTSYISANRVRTDFTGTDSEGNELEGSMIMDGDYMHTWNSASPNGLKLKVTDDLEEQVNEEVESFDYEQDYMDPDEKVEYSCAPWNEDASVFTPPTNITFTDMSQQMDRMMDFPESETPEDVGDSCAVCDSLPADAAAACREGLGCE